MDKTTSSSIDPRHIRIADYDYPLPDERIARFPLAQRDQAKLLTYLHGQIGEDRFCHLGQYLEPGGLMVFNDTKVINARLVFHKDSGARIEIFCLEPAVPADYALNLGQKESASWTCLVGNLKKWKEGPLTRQVEAGGHRLTLTATRLATPAQATATGDAHQLVTFSWDNPQVSMADILEAAGQMPIPPYLKRETQESDLTDYQTVYAHWQGSVAAPTAGLHFTPELMESLKAEGMELQNVTLHVGAGTFRPVKSEEAGGHPMHAERFVATRALIDALMRHQAQATAVGTTSVRALESLYHIGAALCQDPDTDCGLTTDHPLNVSQWQPYDQPGRTWPTPMQALQALTAHMDRLHTDALHASTSIIIAPGYDYRFVRAMVTNFHQPHSTLLLLVAAFVGEDWRRMYDYALEHDFRFLSYGDGALLVPRPTPTRQDNGNERLPLVDEEGHVTGTATREWCHSGSMALHPVVHLHVTDPQGRLYLQRRPLWKDIQPGRWDTAVGGHVDAGESIAQALEREAREELGLAADVVARARFVTRYVYPSDRERELVHTYLVQVDSPEDLHPNPDEVDGARFWTADELAEAARHGLLTPNLTDELRLYLQKEIR